MSNPNRRQLIDALKTGIVEVRFTKANGTERLMKSTLLAEHLPDGVDVPEDVPTASKPKNPDVIAVWDTEANGWRSFRLDSVDEIKGGYEYARPGKQLLNEHE